MCRYFVKTEQKEEMLIIISENGCKNENVTTKYIKKKGRRNRAKTKKTNVSLGE